MKTIDEDHSEKVLYVLFVILFLAIFMDGCSCRFHYKSTPIEVPK